MVVKRNPKAKMKKKTRAKTKTETKLKKKTKTKTLFQSSRQRQRLGLRHSSRRSRQSRKKQHLSPASVTPGRIKDVPGDDMIMNWSLEMIMK